MLSGRFHARIAEIPAIDWNALIGSDQPFLQHGFLDALEQSGSIRADYGWQPHHFALYEGERLVAAAPVYLKGNSHGEFIFDWAWAQAYARNGIAYYPKLLVGVPYTPVTGPRLLTGPADAPRSAQLKAALRDGLMSAVENAELSSVHFNFLDPADAGVLESGSLLPRRDLQFHWRHEGEADFEAFLARFERKKRKNVLQERRKVAEAGVRFRWLHGDEIDSAEWDAIHALYARTFDEKGNTAALTADFFRRVAALLPRQVVVIRAEQAGVMIAAAICFRDASTLYGRYWGSTLPVTGLHFETCYYQGIEYCLAHGLSRFEPGAQGEHKLFRGFLPVWTRSAHHIVHPGFRHGIGRSLLAERQSLLAYRESALAALPFRAGCEAATALPPAVDQRWIDALGGAV
ncbi:MAG: GNAT family N-acetyltransferase [Xanthomonadales bacterium]|jgi:hypothetical protein|nr:GNAT family N-acetyltransferase [Xanthomonadales bacterium]